VQASIDFDPVAGEVTGLLRAQVRDLGRDLGGLAHSPRGYSGRVEHVVTPLLFGAKPEFLSMYSIALCVSIHPGATVLMVMP
jgi:hypothetical protein